jgi:dTDP-4-dehydrorhamnose reductase
MIKVLILGSSGLLGKYLYRELKNNKRINLYHSGLNNRKFDFTKKIHLENLIINKKPNLIINTIGLVDVEKCERQSKISKKINFGIIQTIFNLKNKKKINFNLIHISTDQLYNKKKLKKNNENSKIFLTNNYCKHKRMAEKICIKNNSLVLRTNFFGKSLSKNKSFFDWIISTFKSKKKFYLFDDVYFNPLRIKTIVKILSLIIKRKQYLNYGIYNLGSKDAIFKNTFAIQIARKMKIFHTNYINININKLLKVKRPLNMFMDVNKFEKKFHIKLPFIRQEIINEIKNYKNNENKIRKKNNI